MNVLCIDTSGPSAGVAVLKDGRLAFECELTHGMTHSQCIMPMVEQGLAGTGLQTDEVDLFAAVVGPGSFTGVRIGVSTVKALAFGALTGSSARFWTHARSRSTARCLRRVCRLCG